MFSQEKFGDLQAKGCNLIGNFVLTLLYLLALGFLGVSVDSD